MYTYSGGYMDWAVYKDGTCIGVYKVATCKQAFMLAKGYNWTH